MSNKYPRLHKILQKQEKSKMPGFARSFFNPPKTKEYISNVLSGFARSFKNRK